MTWLTWSVGKPISPATMHAGIAPRGEPVHSSGLRSSSTPSSSPTQLGPGRYIHAGLTASQCRLSVGPSLSLTLLCLTLAASRCLSQSLVWFDPTAIVSSQQAFCICCCAPQELSRGNRTPSILPLADRRRSHMHGRSHWQGTLSRAKPFWMLTAQEPFLKSSWSVCPHLGLFLRLPALPLGSKPAAVRATCEKS